jgi:hypothetical protein
VHYTNSFSMIFSMIFPLPFLLHYQESKINGNAATFMICI